MWEGTCRFPGEGRLRYSNQRHPDWSLARGGEQAHLAPRFYAKHVVKVPVKPHSYRAFKKE